MRAYTWHTYRVHVDVQALQISLLAGRIFFKGFRYHGSNETVCIHSGYITWRYWLRNVRHADCARLKLADKRTASSNDEKNARVLDETGGIKGDSVLPCRLVASLQGLEWYIYNRSAAYDTVIECMIATASDCPRAGERLPRRQLRKSSLTKR